MLFRLEKPNLTNITTDQLPTLFTTGNKEIFDFIKKTSGSEYLYWEKIKHKEPSPEGISKEELWMITKLIRESQSLQTPLVDQDERNFTWSKLNYFEELFHELDMNTGGELFVERGRITKANKQKLITRGIMEEAIASSQLEGADTSRQAAKKLLREGTKPRNKSEQMIVNNYISMRSIEEEYRDKAMSMDLILELHGLITQNTLDSQNEKPRMRKKGEPICVSNGLTGIVYYEGPDMDFVERELEKFIQFANDKIETEVFIHPIIKAIMLHFWIGYLHPFTDGNGRLARLLFYWYLIKKGYWAFVYLPISKVIKKSKDQYLLAYVYSEQDDNDLTYFIDYNLKKIKLATQEFEEYLERQSGRNITMKKKGEERYNLNERQVYLLQYLYGAPDARTSLMAHMNVNQVAKMTASKDLKNLVEKGFLVFKKQGRNVYYYSTDKVKELFVARD